MLDKSPITTASSETVDIIVRACLAQHPEFSSEHLCVFMVPFLAEQSLESQMIQRIRSTLSDLSLLKTIPMAEVDVQIPIPKETQTEPLSNASFYCFVLQTRSVEKARDQIKKVLWKTEINDPQTGDAELDQVAASEAFKIAFSPERRDDLITELAFSAINRSLSTDIIFWRSHPQKNKTISTHSFDHGGGHFYRFRLNFAKLSNVVGQLSQLNTFLLALTDDCPNHFFKQGPRVSARKWLMYPQATRVPESDLPRLAREGIEMARYKGAHDNVEVHCLETDNSTVAVEVPIWWERSEMGLYAHCFPNNGPLSGHIDIVRVKDSCVEIWDYKPDIVEARMVGMQVLIYAIALAIRTGIPLGRFKCGYFDTESAWIFSPSIVELV